MFPHCWPAKQFLLRNGSYVYKESEFSIDNSFHKKGSIDFVSHLGYIRGVVTSDEANKKFRNRCLPLSAVLFS